MRIEGELERKSDWALFWLLQLLRSIAPRVVRSVGGSVDMRNFPDDCAIGKWIAVFSFVGDNAGRASALPPIEADAVLNQWLDEFGAIYG